jgi:hypothetical protein
VQCFPQIFKKDEKEIYNTKRQSTRNIGMDFTPIRIGLMIFLKQDCLRINRNGRLD